MYQSMPHDDPYAAYRHSYPLKVTPLKQRNEVHQFRLPIHYKPFLIIGSGAYGIVCAAVDQSIKNAKGDRQRCVAIKKISQNRCSRILSLRILRQMKILRNLNSNNVVKLKTIILPESRQSFNDLYLVFELLDTDLYVTIKNKVLLTDHIKFFITRIIEGMRELHSYGVLHRDLKPRNILVSKDCSLKICDFGLSRVVMDKSNQNLTDYVTTRWYRAPQLLLGFNDYSDTVDIWSIGCLLAQMILGKPLLPGKTDQQQWDYISEYIGFHLKDVECFGSDTQQYLLEYFKKEKDGNFQQLLQKDPVGADLVIRMLKINPKQRITLEQALNHPYIQDVKKQKPSKQEKIPLSPIQFQFQNQDLELTNQQLKDMIYQEILLYHFPVFAQNYQMKKMNGISLISHILTRNRQSQMDQQF